MDEDINTSDVQPATVVQQVSKAVPDSTMYMQSSRPQMTLDDNDMASVAFLFMCDLWSMHINMEGPLFYYYHDIFNDYYNKAKDDVDYFSEKTKENGGHLGNMSRISDSRMYNFWDAYSPDDLGTDIETVIIPEFSKIVDDYLECCNMWRASADTTSQSEVDDIISYWQKENAFKNKQQMSSQSLVTIG